MVPFEVLRPHIFPTLVTFHLPASGNGVPPSTGKADLCAGYALVLWKVLALGLRLGGLDHRLAVARGERA